MIILRYHEIFSGWQHQQPCQDTLVPSAWKKSHDIVILFSVKGQAKYNKNLPLPPYYYELLQQKQRYLSSFTIVCSNLVLPADDLVVKCTYDICMNRPYQLTLIVEYAFWVCNKIQMNLYLKLLLIHQRLLGARGLFKYFLT